MEKSGKSRCGKAQLYFCKLLILEEKQVIKGCQKRVLWVKNIGNECFDGAFFIVSDKSVEKKRTEESMVAEASRIISSSAITNYFGVEESGECRAKEGLTVLRLKWFSVGLLLATAVSLLLRIF